MGQPRLIRVGIFSILVSCFAPAKVCSKRCFIGWRLSVALSLSSHKFSQAFNYILWYPLLGLVGREKSARIYLEMVAFWLDSESSSLFQLPLATPQRGFILCFFFFCVIRFTAFWTRTSNLDIKDEFPSSWFNTAPLASECGDYQPKRSPWMINIFLETLDDSHR